MTVTEVPIVHPAYVLIFGFVHLSAPFLPSPSQLLRDEDSLRANHSFRLCYTFDENSRNAYAARLVSFRGGVIECHQPCCEHRCHLFECPGRPTRLTGRSN